MKEGIGDVESAGIEFRTSIFGERGDVSRTIIGRRCRGVNRQRSQDLRPAARLCA